ncbi:type II secretion system protein GspN [Myxococcota bacterium]|nr:type II secretion system protein GspN [Myxococcota bacterium]
MQRERLQKLLRWTAYAALAFFSFLFFLYQTFPYRRLFDAFSVPVQRATQTRIQMNDLRPYYLTGVHIQDLNLQRLVPKGIAEVQIPQVRARLSIFPLLWGSLSASFFAEIASGELNGSFSRSRKNEISVQANLDGLQLALLGPTSGKMLKNPDAKPLLEILFAPVFGAVRGDINLDLLPPTNAPAPQGKNKRPTFRPPPNAIDLNRSTGKIKLTIRNFSIGPGYFPAGQMGELPVPRLNLGTLNIEIKMEKAIADLSNVRAFGGDIDLQVTGKIQLNPNFRYSIFRGDIRFKIEKDFINSLKPDSLLKVGLGALPTPKPDGYITYNVYFPFYGQPRFTPR